MFEWKWFLIGLRGFIDRFWQNKFPPKSRYGVQTRLRAQEEPAIILRAQKSQLFWSRDAQILVLFCNGGHCWFMQDHIVWMHQCYFSVYGECPRHLKVWNFSTYHYLLIWGILEALKRDYSRIIFFYKLIGCSIWELLSSFIQFHGIWSSQNAIYLRSHLVGMLNRAIIIIIIINHEKLWQNTAKECSIHICVERCIELDD